MNGVTLSYFTLGTIRPEDNRAVFCIAKPKSPDHLGMYGGKSPRPRTLYQASEGNTLNN